MVGGGLLLYIENLDIFQSHLDCKDYSCRSPKTVKHMTRHQSYDAVDGVMMHLSDDEA